MFSAVLFLARIIMESIKGHLEGMIDREQAVPFCTDHINTLEIIDFKKAFSNVIRKCICRGLRKRGILGKKTGLA